MRRLILSAAAAIATLSTAVGAQWRGEFALPAVDAGFVLGWVSSLGNMREYVPRGEAVERWTRMVTVQQSGYKVGLTPERWLRQWTALMQRGCPGAVIGAITPAPLDDHPGMRVSVACPLNPGTRLPESTVARAILGDQGIQTVQAAARRPFSDADTRWADAVVTHVSLCGEAASAPRCARARSAPIGSPL